MLIRFLQREFRLCFYARFSALNALIFFLMIASLFPLATSSDPKMLQFIGPGVIWVSALLAMLLSMQAFFKEDYRDGSLDFLLMIPASSTDYVLAKVIVHWIGLGLPLIFLTPIIGLFYQLNEHVIIILILGLLLGTPSLTFIGTMVAALTVTLRQNSLLVLLMALPLYAPILIFGAAAPLSLSAWPLAAFGFLAAIFVLVVTLFPVLISKVLRYSILQ